MFGIYWRDLIDTVARFRQARCASRQRRQRHNRPRLEALEPRLVLATLTWTGGDGNVDHALWSNSANWTDSAGQPSVPVTGDDLIFPASAATYDSQDDLGSTLIINSITFTGTFPPAGLGLAVSPGYSLVPDSNSDNTLSLLAGIQAVNTSGTNSIDIPIVLLGSQTFASTNGGALLAAWDINPNGFTLTVGGAGGSDFSSLGGTGAIVKDGAGKMSVLSPSLVGFHFSGYSGTFTVNGGTLEVDAPLTNNPVTVNSGATLTGYSVVGPLTVGNGGRILPGQFPEDAGGFGPGTLQVNGAATFNAGSILDVELNSYSHSNRGYGSLAVAGQITLNDATLLSTPGPGFDPDTYAVLTSADHLAIFGTFQGLPEGGHFAITDPSGIAFPFSITYKGGQGNDVVLTGLPINPFVVTGWYRDLLHRPPDDAGLKYWTGLLDSGDNAPLAVLRAFMQTAEYRDAEVDQFYQEFFHRAADPGGRSFWANLLLHGVSEKQVMIGLATSPEYETMHPDSTAFVDALYADILSRSSNSDEESFWRQQLDSGALTQAAVVNSFLTSPEYYDDTVRADFQAFLGRAADSGGEQFFDRQLQSGRRTPASLVVDFLLTLEYQNHQVYRA